MSSRAKRALAIAAACGTLLSVAACGSGSGSGSSSAGGTVTLRYDIWDVNEKPAYQASIDKFEQANPNIKVNLEVIPWAQYWTKLPTEFAGRTAPDVFWDHLAYMPAFTGQNVLADLTPQIKADNVDLAQYDPKLAAEWKQGEKTYGLPKDWDTIATVYNSAALKTAGLTADQLAGLSWNPTDGGTFLKAMQQLTLDKNGKHPTDAGFDANNVKQYGLGLSSPNGQTDWWNFAGQNGCALQDKAWGQWTINQPSCVEAIQFLADLRLKYHVVPPASETNSANGGGLPQLIAQGTVATAMDGSWDLPSYYSSLPKGSWGVAELPAGPKGRATVYNGLSDAVYAGSKHPKEAWQLVKWLASADSETLVSASGTVWSGIPSINNAFAAHWQQAGVDVTAFQKGAQGNTVSYPVTDSSATYNVKVLDPFNQVWLGQLSPQAAADKVNSESNAAIKKTG